MRGRGSFLLRCSACRKKGDLAVVVVVVVVVFSGGRKENGRPKDTGREREREPCAPKPSTHPAKEAWKKGEEGEKKGDASEIFARAGRRKEKKNKGSFLLLLLLPFQYWSLARVPPF